MEENRDLLTNEQLAEYAKKPENWAVTRLWERVSKIVYKNANAYYRAKQTACVRSGVSIEDLEQSGFLAMLDAVKAFDPAAGFRFVTFLKYPLLNHWNKMVGLRGSSDALNQSVSLDEPLAGEDGEFTRGELIVDPQGEVSIDNLIDRIQNEQLHEAIVECLDELPDEQRQTIEKRYFENLSFQAIGEETGADINKIRSLHDKGLRALRNPPHAHRLSPYHEKQIELHAWRGTGISAFHEYGASSVERAIERIQESKEKAGG